MPYLYFPEYRNVIMLALSVVNLFLIYKFPRKFLLIVTTTGLVIAWIIQYIFQTWSILSADATQQLLTFLVIIGYCFNMVGPTSLPAIISVELFPNSGRGYGTGLTNAMNVAVNILLYRYCYIFRKRNFLKNSESLFSISMGFMLVTFIIFFLPETHRKSLCEIEQKFLSKNSKLCQVDCACIKIRKRKFYFF